MDILAKLLGGIPRVKLLRLFLFNADGVYDKENIVRRTRSTQAVVTRELNMLVRLGLVRKKTFLKEVEKGTGRNKTTVKKRALGYCANTQFEYFTALQDFLVATLPVSHDELIRQLRRGGKIRLVIVSGFFMHEWEQRLDLLVVGDRLNDEELAAGIRTLEAELGREMRYATLSTEDFRYRYNILDRLVRDVLDYPHVVVLDKMGME